MDDKLNAILNDPDKMKAAFEAASQFLGKNNQTTPTATASAPPTPPATSDLASMLKTMQENGALDNLMQAMSNKGGTTAGVSSDGAAPSGGSFSAPNIAQMLPQIMQMMGTGGGGGINSQRADLVNALKPYMKESRMGSVDRAMSMANMAKNAKSMLGAFKK